MSQQKDESITILHQLMDIGEILLLNGAEVNRVEDTLVRLGTAYGASRMNVFVITSSVVITMAFPDGREITQTRRILGTVGTDFTKLEAFNELSRRCCNQPISASELAREIEDLNQETPNKLRLYLGSALAAGSFAVFFGGTFWDGIVAAIFGLLICGVQGRLLGYCMNKVIFNLVISLLSGLLICGLAVCIPVLHPNQIIIGDIMLLIPGIAMTNSIRDILVGDTMSGIMRLTESLLWAGALAGGFMISIWITGV